MHISFTGKQCIKALQLQGKNGPAMLTYFADNNNTPDLETINAALIRHKGKAAADNLISFSYERNKYGTAIDTVYKLNEKEIIVHEHNADLFSIMGKATKEIAQSEDKGISNEVKRIAGVIFNQIDASMKELYFFDDTKFKNALRQLRK